MPRTFKCCLILLFCFFLILFTTTLVKSKSHPSVVWIIIDQVSLLELEQFNSPNIDELFHIGASGLMNARQADDCHPGSTYLSLSTGKKCNFNNKIGYDLNREVSYSSRGEGIINHNFKHQVDININNNYQAHPGLLGEILRRNDIEIAILGNNDTINKKGRNLINLAADRNGRVPLGNVSQSLLRAVDLPGDYRSNWELMFSEFKIFKEKADVIFIETGDMSRIEDHYGFNKKYINEKIYYKKKAFKNIDGFVGKIKENLDLTKTQLGLTVPTPSTENILKNDNLSWVVLLGPRIKTGLLRSDYTRQTGLVLITDLLPELLDTLKINSSESTGNGLRVVENSDSRKFILDKYNKITINTNLRVSFIRGFILLQLLIIILSIINFYMKSVILDHIIEYILLGLLLAPINFLIISNLGLNNGWFYLLLLIIITFLEESFIIIKYHYKQFKVLLITFILSIILILELLGFWSLMPDSLLGYSSQIGARYYGIGNEYMGLFLGASLIFILLVAENGLIAARQKSIVILYLICISLFVGVADLGANFGGAITALIITGVVSSYFFPKCGWFKLLLFFAGIFILIVINDYLGLVGNQTHIGMAASELLEGNFTELKLIVLRKILMNIKLLRWTIWTRVLLAFIFCLYFLFHYPVGVLKNFFNKTRYLSTGYYAVFIASIATMFINDSGVVAAATLLFYPILSLLYIINDFTYK